MATAATDQIIEFIGRDFRGHDLACLVAGVLHAQGFETRVSPPGPDGGVDIVAGGRPMGFGSRRLCVQVKSGVAPVGVSVLRELQDVMESYGAEQGLIVAWGGFTRDVYREARQLYFKIRLWDQMDLVEALQDAYDHLDVQIQAELPLKQTWMLVMDEGQG